MQRVREQLILNQLTYDLPTFGFAGATIWWFKPFFFFTNCLYAFICIYFNEYLSWEKYTSNYFYSEFKKKKLLFKQFYRAHSQFRSYLLKFGNFYQNFLIFSKFLIFTQKHYWQERIFFLTKTVSRLIFHENGSIHFFYPKLNKMDITAWKSGLKVLFILKIFS